MDLTISLVNVLNYSKESYNWCGLDELIFKGYTSKTLKGEANSKYHHNLYLVNKLWRMYDFAFVFSLFS